MIKLSIVLTRQRPSLRMEISLFLHLGGPAEANNSLFLITMEKFKQCFRFNFCIYRGYFSKNSNNSLNSILRAIHIL